MSKLTAFLQPIPAGKTKEVYIADRFKDESGKVQPFVVQAITPEKNEQISRESMDSNGRLDAAKYGNKLIVTCVIQPDLKDAELCKYYGVMDPEAVPSIMFSVGEKQILQEAILEINDLKRSQESKLEKAKNS